MLSKKHFHILFGVIGFSILTHSTPAQAIINLPPQDYVQTLRATDFYSNVIKNKFLSTLANEYKSYALFKANFTPDYEMANYFATKAINAYHGETVRPEDIYTKNLPANQLVEISNYYEDLLHFLDTDLVNKYPQLMAEAQAKFDCWVDSLSRGASQKQALTCQNRFMKARKYLFAKLNDGCGCEKSKKTKQKKPSVPKYDGKILSIPKWPNLPIVSNNPPIPVIKHTVVRELTVSKEIKESISRIEKSINDINTRLSNNQTKAEIEDIKKQIEELKRLLKNSSQDNLSELQKKLSELEEKLSKISCSDSVAKPTEPEPTIEAPTPEETEEEVTEPEEEVTEEEIEEEAPAEEEEHQDEEYLPEEEPEFESVDEDEYLEIEIKDAPSTLLPYEIFFNWNDATVDPKFNDAIKDIAENAQNSEEMIIIKGHTDASGTPEYNQKLSKKRAENVGKIIMSYGVPKERIILQGVGSTEPKVQTKTGEKNAQNRRVVIK